jgi:hypothetical protein
MSLTGTWRLKIDADDIDPEIVPFESTLTFTGDDPVTGTISGPHPMGDDVAIEDFAINGDTVTFHAAMRGEKLRAQELDFNGILTDTAITGKVEVGIFGTASFSVTKD